MRILNSVPSVMDAFPDGKFDMSRWRAYSAVVCPGLTAKCENDAGGYDFEKEVLPVINHALGSPEKMERLSQNFQHITEDLPSRIQKLFDREIELEIILYLGLCNGAGWATALNHKDAVLLGIEKIIELDWYHEEELRALLFHEIGHVWHKTYGKPYFPADTQEAKAIRQLWQEGIAMVCEQILCGDDHYYHQDKDGWLSWCLQNERLIQSEYLNRLKASESTQDFFGDWNAYRGHPDVGYFLGCRFITKLRQKYSLTQIAGLPCNTLLEEFTRYCLA